MEPNRKKSFFFSVFLSVLSGVLLVFAFPPYNAWPLAFFALVPLLFSARGDSPANFFYGMTAGFVFFASSFSWLYGVAGPVYLLLAFYLSTFFGLFLYLVFALPERGRVFFAAFAWVLLEFIVSGLLTGFPWLLLGLSQWSNQYILKVAGLFGIYGISFLVVLGNMVIFSLFRKRHAFSSLAAGAIFAAACFLPPWVVYGNISREGSAGFLDVMVVQPNVDASVGKSPHETLDIVKSFTASSLREAYPDMVIWPEGSFPGSMDEYPEVKAGLVRFAEEHDTSLLFGTFTGAENGVYNSALLIDEGMVQEYNKVKLVPYGEFIPGRRCRVIERAFERIAGYIPDVRHGETLNVFEVGSARIAPLICFENVFPSAAGAFSKKGCNVFVVITNDSWFGKSAGPYQHFAHNVMRAAETGKYFVQSSLTGISGVISPCGGIENVVRKNGEELFVEGVIFQRVPLLRGKTLYSAAGDIPIFLLAVIFSGAMLCRKN